MMTARQLMTCTRDCAGSLREDDRHGAIYGPYMHAGRFIGRLEYAGRSGACIYCGAQLPRGRAARIMRRLSGA